MTDPPRWMSTELWDDKYASAKMKRFICFMSSTLFCLTRGVTSLAVNKGNWRGLVNVDQVRRRVHGLQASGKDVTSGFESLGVVDGLRSGLESQGIHVPTLVQRKIIPRLMQRENILIAASTGSGKTLSYVLPTMQMLSSAEEQGYLRKKSRPRVIVLVPTRELAQQVLQAFKSLSHFARVSSCAVLGGEQYSIQKKKLDRLVDVVVASPGRLRKHKEEGNIFFSEVDTVIVDEVDTMLHQGFGEDVRYILKGVMSRRKKVQPNNEASLDAGEFKRVQIVMATATLTQDVNSLTFDLKDRFHSNNEGDSSKPSDVKFSVVKVDGLHHASRSVQHIFEPVHGNRDKIDVLSDILNKHKDSNHKTAIFCNSIASCQAVAYGINEAGFRADSYHGDLNSRMRGANLASFRDGDIQYLVCTDIASRGLDIPDLNHVIMFDFPLNPVEYLHRAGRCGRMGKSGTVTSIISKKDQVLSAAIVAAIEKNLPLESLSSDKRDYIPGGKLYFLSQQGAKHKKK